MPWLVCLSAGLFFLYEFFQLNLFDVINGALRAEFQLDAWQVSWMSSTYLWADILFLLPAGMILDRYSTRRVILLAMGLCVFGTFGFAKTSSYAWACFFHALTGIGQAFCFLSCVILVARWFPPRRQALVIGCLVTMAFLGGMMAHTPLAYLNEHYGWRYALFIDGVLGAVIFIWIAFFVRDKPHALSQGLEQQNTAGPKFLDALCNRQNFLLGLYTCCLNLPIMVLCALWGASYLQVVHHVSSLSASNIVSCLFIGSMIGCPLAGWLSDRAGRRRPWMIIGAVLSVFALLPLLTGHVFSELVLSALFFILGLVTSTQVISYPFIAESNKPSNIGAATAIASVIIMGGGGVAQVVFGCLLKYHAAVGAGTYALADFQFALLMFPIAVMIALLAVVLTRETYCESRD